MKLHFKRALAALCALTLLFGMVPFSFAEPSPDPCEHDYQMTVIEPTYFEEGYEVYTCSLCGYTYKKLLSQKEPSGYFLEVSDNRSDWSGLYMIAGMDYGYNSDYDVWYATSLKVLCPIVGSNFGSGSILSYCDIRNDQVFIHFYDSLYALCFEKSTDSLYPDSYTIRSLNNNRYLSASGHFVEPEKLSMESGDIYWNIHMGDYGNIIIENQGRYLVYDDEQMKFDVQIYYTYNGSSYPACEVFPIYLFKDACECIRFNDIDTRSWYHEGVEYVLENEIMGGMSSYTFEPNSNLTRAQLVTILYRIAGKPSVEGLENPFTDVSKGTWYTDAVIWAASEGIVNGMTATSFAPNKNISREQIAAILYRYAGKPAGSGTLSAFPDAASVSSYAVDAMSWAVGEGIINGMGGKLTPMGNATRAQISTILYRYLTK